MNSMLIVIFFVFNIIVNRMLLIGIFCFVVSMFRSDVVMKSKK